MIATLATADRLLWLEDHHAAAVAAAGTAAAPDRLRSGIALRDLSFSVPGYGTVGAFLAHPHAARRGDGGDRGGERLGQDHAGQAAARHVPADVGDDRQSTTSRWPSIAHESWRERCTAAFQDFARFSLPAVESVGVADLPELSSEPLALAALDRAGAAELAGQLPVRPVDLRRRPVHRRPQPVRRPVAEARPRPRHALAGPAPRRPRRADGLPGRARRAGPLRPLHRGGRRVRGQSRARSRCWSRTASRRCEWPT